MLEKENKRLKENEIENERGRSMVEMLGVLAIMGVLAIGGIAGYRYAMDKYNANEILNEVRKRAITASQQRLFGQPINLSEYGVNTVQGYAIETADNYNGNATQFTITVKGINQGVCNQVIDSPLPMVIEELVGGVVVADDVDCTAETNDVLFAFANDLSSKSVGEGDDGNGGEENPPEEFDPTAPENNVFCTYYGCYRCDDTSVAPSNLDDSACAVCSNRENVDGVCIIKDFEGVCGFYNYDGCYPCDTPKGIYVGSSGSCEEKCPNRVKNGSYCVLNTPCDGFRDSWGGCYPCDTPEVISVGSSGTCEEKCPNRIKNGNYCNLISTCENGFQDYWGHCYPCDTPEGIDVGRSGPCEEKCPNRIKNGIYCILNTPCDGFQTSSGSCYPCDTPEGIWVGSSGTCEEACQGSGYERVQNGSYCNLKSICDNGFQNGDGRCYSCDTPSPIGIGSDGVCSEACTGSDRRFKKGSYCNLCPKNVASIALNTQETCEACGGQWNGSGCCDGDRCAVIPEPSQPESSVSGGYQPEQTVSGYY